MGARQSTAEIKDPFDTSNLEFDTLPSKYTSSRDKNRYVKWKDVPQEVKDQMKSYVAQYINEQNTNHGFYVPSFLAYFKGEFGNPRTLAILYDSAILEYIRESNLFTGRSITITSAGVGWHINFVHQV